MSGGFLSDMNRRMRANLGMRKRGGYFRDEKETFVNQKKYHKRKDRKKLTEAELQLIKSKVARFADRDQQKLRRHIIISICLFVIVVVAIVLYFFSNPAIIGGWVN